MRRLALPLVLAALLWAGCDSAVDEEEARIVVEGFLNTGSTLPPIHLGRTLPTRSPYDGDEAAVNDAEIEVQVGTTRVAYVPVPGFPGRYAPRDSVRVRAGDPVALDARWSGGEVHASGTAPPEIHIATIAIDVPDEPVSAVLLDSLSLGDSLAVGARTGYIYPIEVTLTWRSETGDEDLWIRAQIRPYTEFTSTVVDLFLRSDEIRQEDAFDREGEGLRTWTGVYAVGVEAADDPLPPHMVRVALVRSGADYARFASTRDAPERREPVSNISGGVGIFTAISVDSTHVGVAHGIDARVSKEP